MQTVLQLVDKVHDAALATGMDVSVADVAFIISTFLEGLAHHPGTPEVDAGLQALADEVSKAKDE